MSPKLAEMEWNWIMFTLYGFLAFPLKIQGIATWNSREKIKFVITMWAKLIAWLVKNGKTVFSKLMRKIYLSVSGKQTKKHLASSFPFLDLRTLSSLLSRYFSGTSCTFHFGQMFNGFLTTTLDFYWSLALQFSCIMVRFSEGRFLFAVASD